MKTFGEFIGKTDLPAKSTSMLSFKEVLEGEGKTSCMSESMCEKLNEVCEAMCSEMKACHEDETEMTAENYMKDCGGMIKEMMEKLQSQCNEYMK